MRTIMLAVAILSSVVSTFISADQLSDNLYLETSPEPIRFLGFNHLHLEASKTDVLVVKYLTDIDLDDKSRLNGEAKKIWNSIESDISKTPYDHAMISACSAPLAAESTEAQFCQNFIWQKKADGWTHL